MERAFLHIFAFAENGAGIPRPHVRLDELFAGATLLCFFAAALLAAFFVFWVYTIVDLMRSEFTVPANKTNWLLLVLFIGPLGVALYWTIGAKQKQTTGAADRDVDTRGR